MRIHQLKEEIISDLELCISYTPDKESDIRCLMEQYLKSKKKSKTVLDNLHHLLNGEPYTNPFESYYFYTNDDICAFSKLLETYIKEMVENQDRYTAFCDVVGKLNALHEKCSGELIDTWRKSKVCELLLLVAESVMFEPALAILQANKKW